jgi:hypothetical protein
MAVNTASPLYRVLQVCPLQEKWATNNLCHQVSSWHCSNGAALSVDLQKRPGCWRIHAFWIHMLADYLIICVKHHLQSATNPQKSAPIHSHSPHIITSNQASRGRARRPCSIEHEHMVIKPHPAHDQNLPCYYHFHDFQCAS